MSDRDYYEKMNIMDIGMNLFLTYESGANAPFFMAPPP